MAEHNDLGQEGEIIALEYLRNKGYNIIETNWKFQNMELDIIAKKDDNLIIIEVKSRKNDFFAEPETAVTKAKQKNIIKGANAYIKYKKLDINVRFDIISILINKNEHTINHIEDAFSVVS